jgi:hypothetical protein
MQPIDGKRFRDLLRGMARTFGSDIDNVTLDVYWLALSGWTAEEFEAAAAHLLRNSRFMPRPADFTALKKAGSLTAAEAWDSILQHCKGAYRDGAGLDNGGPIDTAVRGLGGYRAIAMHDIDYLPIMQRQFVERYQESCDVLETREEVPQLADLNTRPRLRSDGLKRIGRSQ